jgi:LDH2 family malate/lactate/ureidoglycolate dehydrogenase
MKLNYARTNSMQSKCLIFKPEVFLDGGKEELRARMDEMLPMVRGCETAEGVERIYTSGEIEGEVEQKRRKKGIPLTMSEMDASHALAAKA